MKNDLWISRRKTTWLCENQSRDEIHRDWNCSILHTSEQLQREKESRVFDERERDLDEKEKERVLSKQQPKILGNRVSINYLLIDSRNERGCEVEDDEWIEQFEQGNLKSDAMHLQRVCVCVFNTLYQSIDESSWCCCCWVGWVYHRQLLLMDNSFFVTLYDIFGG